MTDALVIVDVQNDFLPGGALAVPEGDRVIDPIVELANSGKFGMVVASRDWHPADHCSFVTSDVEPVDPAMSDKWPVHCVADTEGAELHPAIAALDRRTINKGLNPRVEEYSAAGATTLVEMLKAEGYTRVFVTGLATDYCVRATALDLLAAGFEVVVPRDCVAGITPETSEQAFMDVAIAGGEVWHTAHA